MRESWERHKSQRPAAATAVWIFFNGGSMKPVLWSSFLLPLVGGLARLPFLRRILLYATTRSPLTFGNVLMVFAFLPRSLVVVVVVVDVVVSVVVSLKPRCVYLFLPFFVFDDFFFSLSFLLSFFTIAVPGEHSDPFYLRPRTTSLKTRRSHSSFFLTCQSQLCSHFWQDSTANRCDYRNFATVSSESYNSAL